jgi:acyl-CoA oxidase
MPNILVGEIGPKTLGGMAAVDNGWAQFNHVKLPLDRMLNRFSKIDQDGNYVKAPHSKISYGGMVFIRAQMIGSLAWSLAKGSSPL